MNKIWKKISIKLPKIEGNINKIILNHNQKILKMITKPILKNWEQNQKYGTMAKIKGKRKWDKSLTKNIINIKTSNNNFNQGWVFEIIQAIYLPHIQEDYYLLKLEPNIIRGPGEGKKISIILNMKTDLDIKQN